VALAVGDREAAPVALAARGDVSGSSNWGRVTMVLPQQTLWNGLKDLTPPSVMSVFRVSVFDSQGSENAR
jgi:hypothetical protein